MIAIIVAMEKERDLILPLIQDLKVTKHDSLTFYTGSIASRPVVLMVSGIGKVNAAFASTTLIATFHPALVINTGVAGGTGKTNVLDLIIASEVAYHDVWCGPGTIPGQAAECPPKIPVYNVPENIADQISARKALIVSGDKFISSPHQVSEILDLYPDAAACDMESAAIAHVCLLTHTPFICLRVISDTPGQADNIAQYQNFWSDAPRRTFQALKTLLQAL